MAVPIALMRWNGSELMREKNEDDYDKEIAESFKKRRSEDYISEAELNKAIIKAKGLFLGKGKKKSPKNLKTKSGGA